MRTWIVAAAFALTGLTAAAQNEPRPSFGQWLEAFRLDALGRGIRVEILESALKDLDGPLPVVITRDRTQSEAVLTLEAYLARRVTPAVVRSGRAVLVEHRELLDRVAAAYGVPPSIIVAIWGMESNYGRFTGTYQTLHALATLAWEGRRAAFFREELFNALEILNRGDIELGRLRGSWAGAMGQPQFMPSSYLRFAEDFDADGRRDIWDTPADIFASVGNYLRGNGWVAGYRWGREVRLTPEAATRVRNEVARRNGSCSAKRDMSAPLPLADWEAIGVTLADGSRLPQAEQEAWLVAGSTRHFLVYGNYDALLAYNCAHAYAVAVALLSERIGG